MIQRAQSGFTLIEVTIVMTISSALALIAILGFATLRGQAQFSDSVERLKEQVLVKRQEALSTIKLGGGTDAANITFGRLLTFTPGSSVVQVQTLITANSQAPSAGQAVATLSSEDTSFTIPWGVKVTGPTKVKVAFVRAATDGALQTAVGTDSSWAGPGYSYGMFAPNALAPTATAARVSVVDPSGRAAYIQIDTQSNGVTRVFQ